MKSKALLDFLFPRDEQDPRFREHLEELSLRGLRIAAAIGSVAPVLLWALGVAGVPGLAKVFPFERLLIAVLLGLVPLGISFVRGAGSYARPLGVLVGCLFCLESVTALWAAVQDPIRAAMLVNAKVTLVLLVGVDPVLAENVEQLLAGAGSAQVHGLTGGPVHLNLIGLETHLGGDPPAQLLGR